MHHEPKIAILRKKFRNKLRELSDFSRQQRMDLFDPDTINTRVRGEGLEDILRFKKNGNLVLRYGQFDNKEETEEFVDKGIKVSVKLP